MSEAVVVADTPSKDTEAFPTSYEPAYLVMPDGAVPGFASICTMVAPDTLI